MILMRRGYLSTARSSGYVTLPNVAALKPDAFTVEIIASYRSIASSSFAFGWSPSAAPCMSLFYGVTKNMLLYMAAANYQYFINPLVNSNVGKFHHYVFSLPGSGIADILSSVASLDGVSLVPNSAVNNVAQSAKGAPIISVPASVNYVDIMHIRLYGRFMPTEEIVSLLPYDSRQSYIDDGSLLCDYDMMPVGGIVPDLTGNGYHGTVSGSYRYVLDGGSEDSWWW